MKSIEEIKMWLDTEGIPNHKPANQYVQIGTLDNNRSSIHETRENYYRIYATDSDFQAVQHNETIARLARNIEGTKEEIKAAISPKNNSAEVILIKNGNRILYNSEKYISNLICIYNDGLLIRVIRLLINNYLKEVEGITDEVDSYIDDYDQNTKNIKDLKEITRQDVINAIIRWDNDLDIDPELKEPKHNSKKYRLKYKGKEYNSKVIFVLAYYAHYKEMISTDDIRGGVKTKTTVASLLHELKFEITDYETDITPMDDSYSPEEISEHASSLSYETLKYIAESQNINKPKKTTSSVTSFSRNEYISEYARVRANGLCQLCGQKAPFNRRDGSPYLESHHIIWLSRGGADSTDNTVALCPNCHRKMHVIDDPEDVDKLKKLF